MFITTVALFSPAGWSPAIIAAMLVAIVLMGFPANVAWAGGGQSFGALVSDERRMPVRSAVSIIALTHIPDPWHRNPNLKE